MKSLPRPDSRGNSRLRHSRCCRVAILSIALGGRRPMLLALLASLGLILTACSSSTPQATPPSAPATSAPVVFATAAPTAPPLPSTTASAAQQPLYVTNTGSQGLTMRKEPGGDPVRVVPDG